MLVACSVNVKPMVLTKIFMKLQLVIFTCLVSFYANAQQDPVYAQYLNNTLLINPAFAGSNNMFNATLQYRTQWAGLEANPTTFNFSSHISARQNKLGIGLIASQDKIGDTKNTEVNGVYAYKIKMKNAVFSFGLQAGMIRYTNDASLLTIRDPGDDAFNSLSETKFNMGAGMLLKNDRYIVGLSVPRLVPVSISQGGQSIELYKQHYYLFGAYVWFLSETIRFKPSLLLRGTPGAPFSADVNASFTFREHYSAGIFTRNFKTYGMLLQGSVKSFKLGYVFELPGSPASSLNFVSHEIMVGFSMGVFTYHDQEVKTF
jgi:type IX secretion system PorP/SprF family membrane protein